MQDIRRSIWSAVATTLVMLVGVVATAAAGNVDFNFSDSTPVGSWQEREQLTTDQNGKQTVLVMRIKYLGDEERDGVQYAWIENDMTNYKVKKSGRKQQGDPVSIKFLMKKSVLEGDVVNALNQFRELANEVIMQTGDSQAMRIKGAGDAMANVAQAMELKVSYELEKKGVESVTVPAGTFSAVRYEGSGHTSAKVVFKTIEVTSTATQWVSDEVPFGVVKVVSDDVVNGKPQQSEAVVTAFGSSGATSKITGEPLEMPSLGNIFGN